VRSLFRTAIAAGTVYALMLLALSAARPPHWSRPAGVSDGQVMAAVRDWLAGCAQAAGGYPDNCPQSAQDLQMPAATAFRWQPAASLLYGAQLRWSEAEGLFRAQGRLPLVYQHDRMPHSGALERYQGTVNLPFHAGLRPDTDTRRFGAYEFRAGRPVSGGFLVQNFGDARLRCCDPKDRLP
jgi:hypothetical protein